MKSTIRSSRRALGLKVCVPKGYKYPSTSDLGGLWAPKSIYYTVLTWTLWDLGTLNPKLRI